MVIVYYQDTKEIHHTEDNTMYPALPQGTYEEKKRILGEQGLDFISLPYEMGVYIYHFNLCFDEQGNFIGLQPK